MKQTMKFLLIGLTLLALTIATLGITPTLAVAPAAKAPATLTQLSAGGHVLGFNNSGMFAAAGSHALHVEFVNANNVQPQSDAAGRADGKAAALNQVAYAGLWHGIDLTYAADPNGIYTTTYTLAPGANAENIRLRYNAPLTLAQNGALTMAFETGSLSESAPIAWQQINQQRVAVDVAFQLRGQEVGFTLGMYNPNYALTIDPTLSWNTFLGGSKTDDIQGIAVDGNGNIYVAGISAEVWGSPLRAFVIGNDAFVAKLDSSGALQWHTFLGGSGTDYGLGIALDGNGNIYVTGQSNATWGSPLLAWAGSNDAFAAKLDSSGALQWNTFLGGSGNDISHGIIVDGNGNVNLVGYSTAEWGNPVRPAPGLNDIFAAQLNSSGVLQWNIFLGSDRDDAGYDIAVDNSGNIYLTGYSTASWGSPLNAYTSGEDAFVAKLDSSGSLQWNTFLGSSGRDYSFGIAVDSSRNIYLTGDSEVSWGNPLRAYSSGIDAFVVKLDSSGSQQWNTFLGGSQSDFGNAIVVDSSGNIYLAGTSTASWGSPLRAYSSGFDVFAVKLDNSGSLKWNTFLGSNQSDFGNAIVVDSSGYVYLAGRSTATWGSPLNPFAGGYSDAFIAKIPALFTVTFDANGGSGSMWPQSESTDTALNANSFTLAAYNFTGWNTAADGSGTAYADGALYPFTADVTLYAQWILSVPVSIDQASGQADPINTVSPIHFTAVFAEGVTGFTGSDISFSGTTLTGTLSATVTESAPMDGTTYDVAISGMIPAGTVFVSIPAGKVNSISRPTATNLASTSSDNNVTINHVLMEFGSLATKDGWLLESTDTSSVGGSLNGGGSVMYVGDDASDRQYRSLLHFNTSGLPDNAIIYAVTLRIIQGGMVGTNPFTTHGLLRSEIKSDFFGTSNNLEILDFQAAQNRLACTFDAVPEMIEALGTAYRCIVGNAAFANINRTTSTQFRLRFTLADNANLSADIFKFYSGNFSNWAQRPRLFIKYYLP